MVFFNVSFHFVVFYNVSPPQTNGWIYERTQADLFRRLALRMDAYGISVHRGDEDVEGHTARSPEKVHKQT